MSMVMMMEPIVRMYVIMKVVNLLMMVEMPNFDDHHNDCKFGVMTMVIEMDMMLLKMMLFLMMVHVYCSHVGSFVQLA